MARKVECLYCGQKFTRTQYSEHLEMEHTDEYVKLVERIKSALQIGDDIKYIATNNNITEAFVKKIEKQLMTFIKEDTTSYSPKNSNIKVVIAYYSQHHGNTKKLLDAIKIHCKQ